MANEPNYEKEGILLGLGVVLLVIPIFIAPPRDVSCGFNVICYYGGLTDFGRLATLAGLVMVAAGIILAVKKGAANQR